MHAGFPADRLRHLRGQRSPRKNQILSHARLGTGALAQCGVIAHQEQLAARDYATQQPPACLRAQIADADAQRRDPYSQHASEMAEQPLQRQRDEPAIVVKHRAAAEDQPAALAEQTRDVPGEAGEPVQPRTRLIVENCVDPGRYHVRAELRQARAVVAQQKTCIGQDRAQLFHRDRQQEIVAEIAAAIVSGKQYAGSALVLRHGGGSYNANSSKSAKNFEWFERTTNR